MGVILNWKIHLFSAIGDISIIDVLVVLKTLLEVRTTISASTTSFLHGPETNHLICLLLLP